MMYGTGFYFVYWPYLSIQIFVFLQFAILCFMVTTDTFDDLHGKVPNMYVELANDRMV